MKRLLALAFLMLLVNRAYSASEESEFIKAHIASFSNLNYTAQEFELELSAARNKDTVLKYVDNYSLSIEKALADLSKYKQANNDLIKEVSIDIHKMMTDILKNNYKLTSELIKANFDDAMLQSECEKLVKKNQFISNFLRDVSLGVCMSTVKDKPKNSKPDDQFSRLTMQEKQEISYQFTEIFGQGISKMKKENAATPFEYSCVAVYEFLNLTWIFEKE